MQNEQWIKEIRDKKFDLGAEDELKTRVKHTKDKLTEEFTKNYIGCGTDILIIRKTFAKEAKKAREQKDMMVMSEDWSMMDSVEDKEEKDFCGPTSMKARSTLRSELIFEMLGEGYTDDLGQTDTTEK